MVVLPPLQGRLSCLTSAKVGRVTHIETCSPVHGEYAHPVDVCFDAQHTWSFAADELRPATPDELVAVQLDQLAGGGL